MKIILITEENLPHLRTEAPFLDVVEAVEPIIIGQYFNGSILISPEVIEQNFCSLYQETITQQKRDEWFTVVSKG